MRQGSRVSGAGSGFGTHLLRLLLVCATCTGASACGGGPGPVAAKEPVEAAPKLPEPTGVPPSDSFDLSHWQLTLPVDAEGGLDGDAATIPPWELADGYQSEWFYGSDGNGMTFWAPVNGALTANSWYPRSELRQMLDPADGSVNWSWLDRAEMTALVRVSQVPDLNGKVAVGQVLGYSGGDSDVSELAKLVFEYNAGPQRAKLYALLFPSPRSGTVPTVHVLTESLRLDEAFPYAISVDTGIITFAHEGVSRSLVIDPSWADVGLYFRAGAALFTSGDDAADGARVTFYHLGVSHGDPG